MISGCNARCLTLIFLQLSLPPPRPLLCPPISLILASSLQPHRHRRCLWFRRPSRSYRRALLSFRLVRPFVPPSARPRPSLAVYSYAFFSFLFLPFTANARPSGDRFGATGRNVSRPGDPLRHTRSCVRTRIVPSLSFLPSLSRRYRSRRREASSPAQNGGI